MTKARITIESLNQEGEVIRTEVCVEASQFALFWEEEKEDRVTHHKLLHMLPVLLSYMLSLCLHEILAPAPKKPEKSPIQIVRGT